MSCFITQLSEDIRWEKYWTSYEWVREVGRDTVRERGGKGEREWGIQQNDIQVEKPLFTAVMAKKCKAKKMDHKNVLLTTSVDYDKNYEINQDLQVI